MLGAPRSLQERFEDFVTTLEGFESIDKLLKTHDPEGSDRADYFFLDRSVIVEQKILKIDPSDKIRKFIQKIVKDRGILAYGQVSSDLIFKLPDGRELKARMFDYLTRRVESGIKHADDQMRETRQLFEVPDATGILVILNENAKTLEPDLIRYGVQRTFSKRLPTGQFRYPQTQGVIVITELHQLINSQGATIYPILPFSWGQKEHKERFNSFSQMFVKQWARFNGVSLLSGFNNLSAFDNPNRPIIQLERD